MTETDNTRREHHSIYLNDINAVLPEGKRNYFSYVTYDDFSFLHISHIFAENRSDALKQVLALVADSLDEVYEISIQESKD